MQRKGGTTPFTSYGQNNEYHYVNIDLVVNCKFFLFFTCFSIRVFVFLTCSSSFLITSLSMAFEIIASFLLYVPNHWMISVQLIHF